MLIVKESMSPNDQYGRSTCCDRLHCMLDATRWDVAHMPNIAKQCKYRYSTLNKGTTVEAKRKLDTVAIINGIVVQHVDACLYFKQIDNDDEIWSTRVSHRSVNNRGRWLAAGSCITLHVPIVCQILMGYKVFLCVDIRNMSHIIWSSEAGDACSKKEQSEKAWWRRMSGGKWSMSRREWECLPRSCRTATHRFLSSNATTHGTHTTITHILAKGQSIAMIRGLTDIKTPLINQ